MTPVPWAACCKQRRYGDRSPASYTSIRSTAFADRSRRFSYEMRLRRHFGFRSVSAELPRATCSKITFECSILYRLLLLMGARFLRSSRCRKATGRSIQLTHRNPSGCPLPSLPKHVGRKEPHAIISNPARRIGYSSLAGGLRRICSNSDHRLHLGREKPPRKWRRKTLPPPSWPHLLPSATISFRTGSKAPKI